MIHHNLKNSITIHHIVFTILDLSETDIYHDRIGNETVFSDKNGRGSDIEPEYISIRKNLKN
ncbi:hypothetical protein SPPR111872_14885 [Sphingobacterium prati]